MEPDIKVGVDGCEREGGSVLVPTGGEWVGTNVGGGTAGC